nr:unnamed protein product [Callosobruchus analis]
MLEKIIRNIIMKLHQTNLRPRVIVADQGPNNRNAFKGLGATKENPVVMINEKEILLMFDTPHLLKSSRNNLMNKKVDIITDGIKINWEEVEKTYIIDKRSSMGRSMKEGVKYFLTSCLNQDPLQNLFSVIRNRGGYNPQPTAGEFRIALQHNMHIRLQNSDNSNCEVDDNELLDVTDLNTDCNEDCNNIEATFQSLDSSQEHLEQCSQPLGNSDDTCPDTEDADLLITEIKAAQEYLLSALESDNEESPFTLESCSVAYIAGYLGKFLMDKVNCSCTAENVYLDAMDLSRTDTLIFHRDFRNEEDIRHLKKTTDIFFSVIKSLLSVFDTLFEQVKTEHGMVKKLKTSLLNHLQHSYPTWLHSCRDHKLFIIDQLIKVKVFRLTRWIVENDNNLYRSTFTGKPHRKIRILPSKK